MNNIICRNRDDLNLLIPYIDKPVYVRGYCWGRRFDGWTVIYDDGSGGWLTNKTDGRNLVFDYRGHTYPVFGFLNKFTLPTSSSFDNAFYVNDPDA